MRADTPGFSGNSVCQTPHLDELASQSVVFDDAYAPSNQCSPSRGSMLTGLYAFAHGMGNNADMYHALTPELPHPEQLLTHQLRDGGYRLGYVGKWHVGKDSGPADHGFEGMNLPGYGDPKRDPDYRDYLGERRLSYGPVLDPVYGNGDATLLGGVWNGPTASTPEHYLTDRTCALIDEFAAADQPFLVTCQYWAPHPPYLPSPEYAGMHDRSAIEPWPNAEDDLAGKPAGLRRFREDFYRTLPSSWDGWRELVGLAYDYTALLDAEIGRLLAHLRYRGLHDDTIVVFTSDHGDMNGSHGLFDKGFMYQEAHRVPLLVRWPGRWQPGRRSELVSNMDVLPTVLDAAGLEVPIRHGRSLTPLLGGESPVDWRSEFLLESHGMRQLASQRALVTAEGMKYVFNPNDYDELYDLRSDPGEMRNLLRGNPHDSASARQGREEAPQPFGDPPSDRDVGQLQRRLVEVMFEAGDPLTEYAAKLFGDWSNRSQQPDASTSF